MSSQIESVLSETRVFPPLAAFVMLGADGQFRGGKEIGAIAKPKDIRFGDNLPKTRSGKLKQPL